MSLGRSPGLQVSGERQLATACYTICNTQLNAVTALRLNAVNLVEAIPHVCPNLRLVSHGRRQRWTLKADQTEM